MGYDPNIFFTSTDISSQLLFIYLAQIPAPLDLNPIMPGSIFNPIFYSFKNHTLEFLKRRKRLQITLVSKLPRLYEQHKTMFKYQPYFWFNPNFATLGPS